MQRFSRLIVERPELVRAAAGLLLGAAVLGILTATGSTRSVQDLLVFIGFDPDRSALITALSLGAAAAFTSALVTGQRRVTALLGLVALAGLFGSTLLTETQGALAAHGDQGTFDPAGWLVSVFALVVAAPVVAWGAATLAAQARASLLATARQTRTRVRSRGPRGLANGSLMATVAMIAILALTATVVTNMINYSPDTLFHVGDPDVVGLAPPAPGATSDPARRGTPTKGTVDDQQLPAPWIEGTSDTALVSVYLPAGYASGSTRYPVVLAVPWSFSYWEQGIHIREMLDGLIARGEIPPMIVVFTALSVGGPYQDTECADSADGAEQMETYLSSTVPAWVDSHYRTRADPGHRTVFGFSQGGFCSTMLVLRHPDVFNYAISFGGYYEAAVQSPQTINAARPWGGNADLIASHSPLLLARTIPSDVRPKLFMVLSGTPSQPFYGSQYMRFVGELAIDGIAAKTIDIAAAHSWPSVQAALPDALRAVASTQSLRGSANLASPAP